MFENKKIERKQNLNGKDIYFEPDSSPEAWKHYKTIYGQDNYLNNYFKDDYNKYDFDKQYFYNLFYNLYNKRPPKKELPYVNEPIISNSSYTRGNRLYVLPKNVKIENIKNKEYTIATNRLGGDCDFNFNEKKLKAFSYIIQNDNSASKDEKAEASSQLKRCNDMHHRLLNFSLIQAMGDLQGVKGSNRFDRLDTFISELNKYFCGTSNAVLLLSSPANRSALISFLSNFRDIYEYCEAFYFIKDKSFIDEIIEQGKMPIKNVTDLKRYMDLAEKFWAKKEKYFQERA